MMNDDLSKYLLSSTQRRDYAYLLREAKRELEKLTPMHEMISLYHHRLWFQRIMHMTKEELLVKYHRLAKSIIRYEEAIDEYKTALRMHLLATEELQSSMQPYKGMNLKNIELQQQSLF